MARVPGGDSFSVRAAGAFINYFPSNLCSVMSSLLVPAGVGSLGSEEAGDQGRCSVAI